MKSLCLLTVCGGNYVDYLGKHWSGPPFMFVTCRWAPLWKYIYPLLTASVRVRKLSMLLTVLVRHCYNFYSTKPPFCLALKNLMEFISEARAYDRTEINAYVFVQTVVCWYLLRTSCTCTFMLTPRCPLMSLA